MKRSFRRLVLLAFGLLVIPSAAQAQSTVPPTVIPGFYDGLDAKTAQVRRGESTFYQRCSLCHLPRIRKNGTTPGPAPSLSGVLKSAAPEREKLVRDYILRGSDRMPGWQHAFTPVQLDDLIAYIRTL